MSGHWEYKGEEFENENEMARYSVSNESYLDPYEFYEWLDNTYEASDIIQMLMDCEFSESVYIDLLDEFNDWRVKNAEDAKPGEDYEFGEFEFKWVEDEEEEE